MTSRLMMRPLLLLLPTTVGLAAAFAPTPLAPSFAAPRVSHAGVGRRAPSTRLIPIEPAAAQTAASPVTTGMRALHLAAASCLMAAPFVGGANPMDDAIASLWSAFESSQIVTHQPLFEACVAVGGFVAWIALFESLHLWLPHAAEHRLDKQAPRRPLEGFATDWHKTVVPAVTYLLSIHLFQAFGLSHALFGAKPVFDAAPSHLRVVVEVSLGVLLYDLLFYPFHYSFHALGPAEWRRQHQRHHQWGGHERHAHNAVETVQVRRARARAPRARAPRARAASASRARASPACLARSACHRARLYRRGTRRRAASAAAECVRACAARRRRRRAPPPSAVAELVPGRGDPGGDQHLRAAPLAVGLCAQAPALARAA